MDIYTPRMEYHYGFKKLTAENFLKCDLMEEISYKEWLELILEPQLQDNVPDEIKALYEVARGTMAYGYYFYPIMTLASEQLFRVAEAAIKKKCEELKASKISTFSRSIEWLLSKGIIEKEYKEGWLGIKELRNKSSHPDSQQIFSPPIARGSLSAMALIINHLFDRKIS